MQNSRFDPLVDPVAAHASPFRVTVTAGLVRVEFSSEADFRHCERLELSRGRLFVRADPPAPRAETVRLELLVRGLARMELRATFVMGFSRADAARLGIAPGFVLAVAWPPRSEACPASTRGALVPPSGS
jgi:hypothetical protein